jgi:hypothetical protein
MFGPKVKIEKALYEKIKMYSQIAGYSSVEGIRSPRAEKEINSSKGGIRGRDPATQRTRVNLGQFSPKMVAYLIPRRERLAALGKAWIGECRPAPSLLDFGGPKG